MIARVEDGQRVSSQCSDSQDSKENCGDLKMPLFVKIVNNQHREPSLL